MLGFTIVQPGLFSTFQDEGRLGYQNEGMPISGAMDHESMIIANKLVGKEKGTVLEMTFTGAEIMFEKNMSIALTGADMQPRINNKQVLMYRTLKVSKGDRLSFVGLKSGFRCYVAFSDDLLLEDVFNSQSTYTKIQVGGYKGRSLKKDDAINVENRVFHEAYVTSKPIYEDVIRVLIGYESEAFQETSSLFNQSFVVSNELDRMGMRLSGESIKHRDGADIISSPILPGAIQIPSSGQPMIMLRDAQTIGGYTRIGSVISCDLNKLAQKSLVIKWCLKKSAWMKP